jgi:hypothetical protein
MTDAVIARVNRLALGQPSQPVFTDRRGFPIGDTAMESYTPTEDDDDKMPGVHLEESDKPAEIPGVGSTDQDQMPDLIANVNVDVDFKSSEVEE